VLYVAFTRAKDYLVLSAAGGKVTTGKDFTALGTWLAWLGKVYGFSDLACLPERLTAGEATLLVNTCIDSPMMAAATVAAPAAPAEESLPPGWLDGLAARMRPCPPSAERPFSTPAK
jgi:ATP-dependent exoDNAse (exonuclease V) beta subunit